MTTIAPSPVRSPVAAGPGRPRRRPRRFTARRVAPYLFLLPNMVVFCTFTIWPAISGFNLSLYASNNGRQFTWVGLGNYQRIVEDEEFWDAMRNAFVFVVAFVVLVTVLSTVLALTLNAQRWGKGYFRAVFFLPALLSPVVVGLIWNWALNREVGLVNFALGSLGLPQPGWLVEPTLAMICVIGVNLWTHIGFYGLILLAGLQGIDGSVYDAARMDGARTLQVVRHVTLPLLRPTTMIVLVLATINGFQAFDFIYTLTGGGPLGATTLIVQYIYDHAFQTPIQYGLASAAGVVFFVVVFACTIVNYLVGRRKESV